MPGYSRRVDIGLHPPFARHLGEDGLEDGLERRDARDAPRPGPRSPPGAAGPAPRHAARRRQAECVGPPASRKSGPIATRYRMTSGPNPSVVIQGPAGRPECHTYAMSPEKSVQASRQSSRSSFLTAPIECLPTESNSPVDGGRYGATPGPSGAARRGVECLPTESNSPVDGGRYGATSGPSG